MSTRIARFPALLLSLLFLVALVLTGFNLSAALPRAQWGAALASPDIDNIQQMLFHYSLLPRLAISLLVGAGLGLVGVLFQQFYVTRWQSQPRSASRPARSLGSPSPRCGRCRER